jgi:hypothetical protein
MKHAALIIALALAPLPALAQDSAPAEPEAAEEGPSLMERGLALFFEGFQQEMEPELEEMSRALEQFGPAVAPALERLMAMVDDMTNYELPEMMENGDIIIRRKPDAPPVEPPAEGSTDGEVEL